jgi:hypothetical protein
MKKPHFSCKTHEKWGTSQLQARSDANELLPVLRLD